MSGELLRTGRKVGRTIYVQHGLAPSLDDPLIGIMDTPELAARVVEAVNAAAPVAREDTASPDEDNADPCLEDAHGTCHAPGHSWHEGQQRRSFSPAVAPEEASKTASEVLHEFGSVNGPGWRRTTHCCEDMTRRLAETCPDHPSPWDCPDLLVTGPPFSNEFGLWVHDGGSSYIVIRHCPWCGAKLGESPAVAPDTQSAAPTRDDIERVLVGELSVAFQAGRNWAPGGAAWDTQDHARRIAGVLRGGGADGSGEGEDPNLAHRAAVDTTKLSGPDTRSLLLCAREGRVGGAATIGDSRLNASIVWVMLGNGATPDDVHRSYPWCSVEDAAVLDRLRRDVVEHLDEDDLTRLARAAGVSTDSGDVVQHRDPRGAGGGGPRRHALSNLVTVCGLLSTDPRYCHHWCENERDDSRALGFLVPAGVDPRLHPIRHAVHGWVLLDDHGGFTGTEPPERA